MAAPSDPRPEELADQVDGGLCADIEGLPGSGRSTLLRRLDQELRDRGRQVVRLDGVRALRDRPLGVISVVEGALGAPGMSLHEAVRRLVKKLGSARSALLIDDVDDLDELSGGVVAAARRELGMPVVVTRRPGTDRDQAVRDLLATIQPGVSVHLGPLPFAEIHELLHDVLPDSIEPAVVAHFAVMAGGLPGLAKALATAARIEGSIVRRHGVWRAVANPWPASAGHALAPLLRDLDRHDVDALTLVALARTPTLTRAWRLVDVDRLQRLERMGLVAVTHEPGTEALAVVPPALGEHLVTTCAPLRRKTLESLIDEVAPATLVAPERLLEGNLRDSLAAKRLSDHWEAEHRVLQTRWVEDPTASRAIPLVVATLVRGASPEHVVRQTRVGDGPDDAQLHAWFAVYLGVHRRDSDAARQYAATVRPPTTKALVDATVRYLGLLFDHVPAADEVTPARNAGSELEAGMNHQIQVEREVAVGSVRTARALARDVQPVCPLHSLHLDVAVLLARMLDGELEAGADEAVEAMKEAMRALDPGAAQAYGFVAALGLTFGGRFTELDTLVSSALTVTTRTPVEEHYRAGVITLAAIAARWQGRRTFARRLAFQARALDDRAGPFPGMMPGHLPAIPREGGARAASDLWALADDRLSKGYVVAGTFYGVAALETDPDPRWAERVWSAASSSESVALRALARYAVALGARDPDAIEASRSDLAALGLRTYEARALVWEAVARRRRGSNDRALECIERAWALTSTFGGSASGFFEPFVAELDLSQREFEIIEMISSGLTTNQVASELSISPRTVENHVFSCYRKTGIGNREDMSRAVYTWLTPPSPS